MRSLASNLLPVLSKKIEDRLQGRRQMVTGTGQAEEGRRARGADIDKTFEQFGLVFRKKIYAGEKYGFELQSFYVFYLKNTDVVFRPDGLSFRACDCSNIVDRQHRVQRVGKRIELICAIYQNGD